MKVGMTGACHKSSWLCFLCFVKQPVNEGNLTNCFTNNVNDCTCFAIVEITEFDPPPRNHPVRVELGAMDVTVWMEPLLSLHDARSEMTEL